MVFKVDTLCSKCGKSGSGIPGGIWSVHLGPPVVCFICEPPPLEGSCPTCLGHGTVYLFEAWAVLNRVAAEDRSQALLDLRDDLVKCRTKVEARVVLDNHCFLDRYPLLPDWLPEGK